MVSPARRRRSGPVAGGLACADPGPGLRPRPATTVASPEQQLLRGWRSVILAPIGDGQRRRRGSDGMRLAGAVLALVWGWATLVWMRKREYL